MSIAAAAREVADDVIFRSTSRRSAQPLRHLPALSAEPLFRAATGLGSGLDTAAASRLDPRSSPGGFDWRPDGKPLLPMRRYQSLALPECSLRSRRGDRWSTDAHSGQTRSNHWPEKQRLLKLPGRPSVFRVALSFSSLLGASAAEARLSGVNSRHCGRCLPTCSCVPGTEFIATLGGSGEARFT